VEWAFGRGRIVVRDLVLGVILILLGVVALEIRMDTLSRHGNAERIRSLGHRVAELEVEVNVLTGVLKSYDKLWLAQEARISILEGRYDNLSILENSVTKSKSQGGKSQ